MPYFGSSAHLRVLAAAVLRPEPMSATARDVRIAIVSASIGAGHDGAAAELARRLTAHGFVVDRFDLLDLLPVHLGRLVRDGYHRMLVQAPWAYERVYRSTERAGGGGPLARALLRTAKKRMLRALHPGTGAVVSTYPGASRVLGSLRLRGRLAVPVLTYLTDFSRASAVGGRRCRRPPCRARRARRPGPGRRSAGRPSERPGGRSALPSRQRPGAPHGPGTLRAAGERSAGAARGRLVGGRTGPAGCPGATRLRFRRPRGRLWPQRGAGRAASRGRHRARLWLGGRHARPDAGRRRAKTGQALLE